MEEIGISVVTPTDCANVAYVCSVVSTRAAYLCACGVATLLKRMRKPYVTVGVDGSVYRFSLEYTLHVLVYDFSRFHPTFKDLLDQKIDELVDGKLEVYKVVT